MTKTYKVVGEDGQMTLINAYTESEARQLADTWANSHGGLKSFVEY